MTMKVLITGFEPFGGASLNPSQEVLPLLHSSDSFSLRTAVLPVSFSRASKILDSEIDAFGPDVVIALGQAEGRSEISIERFAINLADVSVADNDGELVTDRVIAEAGPTAYPTTLPAKAMAAAARAAGTPAGTSLSAGAFLCNFVFFHLQDRFQGSQVRTGFIHLPLIPEQAADFPGKPTVSLEALANGLNAALGVMATK